MQRCASVAKGLMRLRPENKGLFRRRRRRRVRRLLLHGRRERTVASVPFDFGADTAPCVLWCVLRARATAWPCPWNRRVNPRARLSISGVVVGRRRRSVRIQGCYKLVRSRSVIFRNDLNQKSVPQKLEPENLKVIGFTEKLLLKSKSGSRTKIKSRNQNWAQKLKSIPETEIKPRH